MISEAVEVAVVGGGPAGALTAMLLADLGHEVVLLERAPRWRWRACGVFSSPASVTALRRLGLREADLARVAHPIAAMRVESRRDVRFALTYGGSGELADSAVGFDRAALDQHLLALARGAGVDVREGVAATRIALESGRGHGIVGIDGVSQIEARTIIGADGLRSRVALAAGVVRRAGLGVRIALSFHIAGVAPRQEARMAVIDHGYVGLAPVPGGRLNVGIVLDRRWFSRVRRDGAWPVAKEILDRLMSPGDEERGVIRPLDHVAGVTPVGHAVARRAGPGWLLVGDAAGFLDPFTGEGLHRAIVSAELAAETAHAALAGRPGARMEGYDRAMRTRFGTKDLVTQIVQAFLSRPVLFEYAARRLAARDRVRETMGLVIGDLVLASRALDPRYLAALLRP